MSKYSTLLLPILTEVLLNEIGEANIPPLKWNKVDENQYKFKIDINSLNEFVDVYFENFSIDETTKQFYLPSKLHNSKNTWNIAYTVGGTDTQFEKSNIKVLFQILSTVVDIIKDFISLKNPDALYIISTEKEKNKIQKSPLYEAYIKKLIKEIPDYTSESRRGGILLIKK